MDILIGGLLMVSLISSPITKIDYVAYELYKTQSQIISALKKYQEFEEEVSMDNVDSILYSIDDNSKKITNMLKEKNNLSKKIDTVMDLYVYAGKRLSNKQLKNYQSYNKFYLKESQILQNNLKFIKNEQNFKNLTNKILLNNENYSNIYKELIEIKNYQVKAIHNIDNLIKKSKQILNVL